MQVIDSIFYVIVLIMSVVVHEFAHGYVAYRFGDNTARMQGRLTLNPIKHLDLFGSILLPLSLILFHAGFVLGWAKPVPYNPHNLRKEKLHSIFVALAGIAANLFLAIIFGLLIRVFSHYGFNSLNFISFYKIATSIVLVNIVLAIFNIVPIPPLDGSKILFGLLPARFFRIERFLEQWGMFVLLFFIITLWQYFSPVIFFLFKLFTGVN